MTRLNKGAVALFAASTLILGYSLSARGEEVRLQFAQDYGAPPADVGAPPADVGAPDAPDAAPSVGASDAQAPDAAPTGGSPDDASLLVRVEKLEEQIRQMNGQIEQMQFENHRLEDQLRKFQEDVDFRFQEGGRGKPKREESGAAPAPLAPRASDAGSTSTPGSARPRGDAFDPSSDPNAPGVPRPLGAMPASAGVPVAPATADTAASDSGAPLNLPSAGFKAAAAPVAPTPVQPQSGAPASQATTPGGTVIASTEVNPTQEEFDVALGYFKQKDYDNAERSFSAFLGKNPKSRWTSDALYYLGETYYQRGRQREAAEQYLKISTDYATSPRAPEAMLRLGESLQALGAKEQACATFSEVPRKYPNASAAVKAGAEREAKRAQC